MAMAMDATPSSHNLINEPFLLSVLQTTHTTRSAALHLLDVSSTPPSSDLQPTPPTTSPSPSPINTPSSPAPPSTHHALAITRAQKPLFALLARLRSQNRQLAQLVRNTKASTSTSRAEVDTLHLSLQNLYYESRHLAGEIAACEGYKHPYRELPLISEEEFLERWPEWRERRISRETGAAEEDEEADVDVDNMVEDGVQERKIKERQDTTADNADRGEGAFMKARIEAEHQERVQLEEQRKKLVARKMELVKENAKRKEELGKLDKELEAFIEAAKPIQKTFETEW